MWYGPVNLSSAWLDKRSWMKVIRAYTNLQDFFAIWTARFTEFCRDLYYGAEKTGAKVLWASLRWDSVHSWWWLLITFIRATFNLCSSWTPRTVTLFCSQILDCSYTHSCLTYEQCRAAASLRCVIGFWKALKDPVFCRCIVRVGNNYIPPTLFVLLCCHICLFLTCWILVDLLKTRMQQGDGSLRLPTWGYLPHCCSMFLHSSFSWLLTVAPISRSHSSVILGTARGVITTDGIKGLWRGTSPSLIR